MLFRRDNIPKRDYMVLRTLLIPKGEYTEKGLYGLKNTLNSEGTEGVEKGEGLVNTSQRREKRGKTQEASTVNFGV